MILKQYTWTAVKKNPNKHEPAFPYFDMYEWNPFKMKWVRISSARFGTFTLADNCAKERSLEIQQMFDNNRTAPTPMVYEE